MSVFAQRTFGIWWLFPGYTLEEGPRVSWVDGQSREGTPHWTGQAWEWGVSFADQEAFGLHPQVQRTLISGAPSDASGGTGSWSPEGSLAE